MAALLAPERTLTQTDYVRLTRILAEQSRAQYDDALELLLAASELVDSPSVSPEVITMYSQFIVVDESTGVKMTLALCTPQDAEPSAGFVSVLAPLGLALLGLRVGDIARWSLPDQPAHEVRVVKMLFQPEASGDYTT